MAVVILRIGKAISQDSVIYLTRSRAIVFLPSLTR